MEPNGKATRQRTTFRLEYAVAIDIAAKADKVWALLTNAAGYPAWNSTIDSIEGSIAMGEQIALKSKIAPGRTFKLKVRDVVANERMTWNDGMAPMFKGVRTYALAPGKNGSTVFSMVEVFSGIMLPMIAGSLPDFAPSFEQIAKDLKRAAEAS
jgi:hypothetical protein